MLLLAAGVLWGGMCATAVVAVFARRQRCPVCGKKRVTGTQFYKQTVVIDGRRAPRLESHYRCEACGAEMRSENGGPLISKACWDEGMRALPPAARVLSPRAPRGRDGGGDD